jgi:hypothetical protein
MNANKQYKHYTLRLFRWILLKAIFFFKYSETNMVQPGYNDIRLYDTSHIASAMVVRIFFSSLLTITLYSLVTKTLVHNDTKYSVPFMAL